MSPHSLLPVVSFSGQRVRLLLKGPPRDTRRNHDACKHLPCQLWSCLRLGLAPRAGKLSTLLEAPGISTYLALGFKLGAPEIQPSTRSARRKRKTPSNQHPFRPRPFSNCGSYTTTTTAQNLGSLRRKATVVEALKHSDLTLSSPADDNEDPKQDKQKKEPGRPYIWGAVNMLTVSSKVQCRKAQISPILTGVLTTLPPFPADHVALSRNLKLPDVECSYS